MVGFDPASSSEVVCDIVCAVPLVSYANNKLHYLGYRDICNGAAVTTVLEMPDDLLGSQNLAQWDDHGDFLKLTFTSTKVAWYDVKHHAHKIIHDDECFWDPGRISELASNYMSHHEASETLFFPLLWSQKWFRHSVIEGIKETSASFFVYKEELNSSSILQEDLAAWVPSVFEASPIGRTFHDLEAFAKYFESYANDLYEDAETLQQSLRRELDAQNILHGAIRHDHCRPQTSGINLPRARKHCRAETAIMDFLERHSHVWLENIDAIAKEFLQRYSKLQTRYSDTLGAFQYRRMTRKSREVQVIYRNEILSKIEEGMQNRSLDLS